MARVIRAAYVEAIQDAARIRRLAHYDARRVHDQAREEGLAEGRAEATAYLFETARLRAKVIEQAEAALIPLVRSVVERILHAAFEDDSTRIVPLLRMHLESLHRAQSIEVSVHPDDASALAALCLEPPTFQILPDDTLQRGDLLIVSDLGRIDACVALRLDALQKAMTFDDA